jgi:hypothetical protein
MAHSVALIDQASVSLPVSQDYSSEGHVLDGYLRREELAQQLGVDLPPENSTSRSWSSLVI